MAKLTREKLLFEKKPIFPCWQPKTMSLILSRYLANVGWRICYNNIKDNVVVLQTLHTFAVLATRDKRNNIYGMPYCWKESPAYTGPFETGKYTVNSH